MSRLHPIPLFILIVLVLATLVVTFSPVSAVTTLPSGFVSEAVVTNLTGPTTIAFAADGRMFIGQKDGRVRVFQNGVLLPTDFINISAQVNNNWDRGLLGIAIHPDFPNTPYVYLLYTYDPPGTTDNGSGARVARLLRVTADPNNTNVALAGSEVVLLGTNSTFSNIGHLTSHDGPASCEDGGVYVQDCIAADSPSHTIGSLAFGTDGSLFVSSGDGAHFNYTDVRALRSLSVDSLNGKILRIDPIMGEGYPDNPFYNGDPTSNRSKVYSLGLRNPFRITVNTLTNELFIGDVGWNTWEEINTGWGRNFGWPCYEGNNGGSAEQGSYKNTASTSAVCAALYAQGLDAVKAPTYSYNHNGSGASVQAGGFYQGSVYPPQYHGALFFSDYNGDWIRYLTFDGNGVATKFDFGTDVASGANTGVVQLLIGPDTNLYYVAYDGPTPNTSQVRRIRYTAGGNTPPTANADADPDSGLMPFTVNFSSAGSFDPDAQVLTYFWDFGDGGTSTDPNPSHEYTVAGDYTVTLTITDSVGDTGSDTVAISAGDLRPVAAINLPTGGFAYNTGDTINYDGTGIDNEDGDLSGASLQWDILLHHNQHVHFDFMPGLIGNTGSFPVPDHGDNTWIELCLTVTDSGGLNDQECVNLQPNTVTLSFDTVPSGLELEYEGVTHITPFDVTTNANSARDLIAPATQGCNIFSSWSDGGAASHQIITGVSPQTYIATYAPCAITASAGTGGTITPSGTIPVTVVGANYTFNSTPNATFILSDVFVDGISVGRANSYTFNNTTSSHTIAASFSGGWSAPTAFVIAGGAPTNPNRALVSDNLYANTSSTNNYVHYTTFGIPTIPAGATIKGIEVSVEAFHGAAPNRNARIFLSWNNGTTFTGYKQTALLSTESTVILGGAADTWGRTWTSTDFTNANFIVRVGNSGGSGGPLSIDQIQVRVTYTMPGTAPTITSAAPSNGTHGVAYNHTYTATGTAPITFSLTAGSLPTGLTLTSAGVLSGTPTAAGTFNGTVTASNGTLPNATQNFSIVIGGGLAPTITSANNTSFTVGMAGTFAVTANGSPTPTFSMTGTLPSGVSFTPATGILSGTPASGTVGTYPVTITASNGILPNATQNFTLTVQKANTTTTISSDLPDPSQDGQNVVVNYTVASSGNSIARTGNVTVSDGVNNCIDTAAAGTCTLALTTVGARTLTATYAGDANFNSSTSPGTSHTVTAVTAPTITSADNTTFTVGVAGTFTVTANGSPTPTFSITGTLPTGVSFSTGGILSGTPADGTVGSYPITITASNGVLPNATQNFTLTVQKANTTITISSDLPDPSQAGQNVVVNYTVASSGNAIARTGNVTVSDGVNNCVGTAAAGTCTLALTTVGARTLTATYAGDANFNGNASLGAAHTVAASSSGGWFAPTAFVVAAGAPTNPNRALVSDNLYANTSSINNYVHYTTFGIPAIPAGATINGIEISVEGFHGAAPDRNARIFLSWNNGTTFTAYKQTVLLLTESTVILGGAADTWGRTWTSTDFTNANFIVRVGNSGGSGGPLSIDQIQVRVTYTLP